jgi:hypothetical protein
VHVGIAGLLIVGCEIVGGISEEDGQCAIAEVHVAIILVLSESRHEVPWRSPTIVQRSWVPHQEAHPEPVAVLRWVLQLVLTDFGIDDCMRVEPCVDQLIWSLDTLHLNWLLLPRSNIR